MSLALQTFRNQNNSGKITSNFRTSNTNTKSVSKETATPVSQSQGDSLEQNRNLPALGNIEAPKASKSSGIGARIKAMAKGALAVASVVSVSAIAAPAALATTGAKAAAAVGIGAIAAPIAIGAGIGAVVGGALGVIPAFMTSMVSLNRNSGGQVLKAAAATGAVIGGAIGSIPAGGAPIVGSMLVGGIAAGCILKN